MFSQLGLNEREVASIACAGRNGEELDCLSVDYNARFVTLELCPQFPPPLFLSLSFPFTQHLQTIPILSICLPFPFRFDPMLCPFLFLPFPCLGHLRFTLLDSFSY